ncbi:hypothetical protein QM090_18215 [Acinetobacter baumannii]|uniref:hypothetical protein n=1 Tax=Acinetobacter baumannii TaxID=470 RepID=UPI0021BEDA94|nr:hypothetical protein [Acinetobacter baumannii]MCT9386633.1 hypothetical protein [Acinetobacter baumannii]MDV5174180.1 hypothetical protein [Acinetobacter baumannii]MDV5176004.1 hypothetical protein [Acinetobacter baumannii]
MAKFQNVVKEKLGKRYLQVATVATVAAFPLVARAEDVTPFMTPEELKGIVSGLGMPALIGAAVATMIGIGVLIWGGRKLIGFFSK